MALPLFLLQTNDMQPIVILKRPVPGLSDSQLAKFTATACKAARLRGTVTVLVGGNREIRALNLRFKGNNRSTDVLSFPAPIFVRGFAGDIAISADTAARNARALGHSASDEIRILVLHGVLHLAGYDHESDNGEMADREQFMRKQLGLPMGLIQRNTGPKAARRKTKWAARRPVPART